MSASYTIAQLKALGKAQALVWLSQQERATLHAIIDQAGTKPASTRASLIEQIISHSHPRRRTGQAAAPAVVQESF